MCKNQESFFMEVYCIDSIIHAITITQETRFAGLGVWVIGDGAGATAVARRAAAIVASAPERRARARCYGLHLC